MKPIRTTAPAKINLTLHVTGQRADGYHLLDSLVVFADVADEMTVAPAPDLSLNVDGRFADGVPVDGSNLVMRAAAVLRTARGVQTGAALTLTKNLPHAAGIGSGSSDAAATLAMLARFWDVAPLSPADPQVAALGADVPVCLHAPAPARMTGVGDVLAAVPALPPCALVLARPPVSVPTQAVFKGLATKTGSPMADIPQGLDFNGFSQWLAGQRNDLQAPAMRIAPQIADVLLALDAAIKDGFAAMSGSGATCFAIMPDLDMAEAVAQDLRAAHPQWWVAAARML